MTAQYSSYTQAGKEQKKGRKGGRKNTGMVDSLLDEAGLGSNHPKTTCCCGTFFFVLIIVVTAWMQVWIHSRNPKP
jgi:hypothetical protein